MLTGGLSSCLQVVLPVGEDVELNLGAVNSVMFEPTLMDFRTDNYLFRNDGNIVGWDEGR